MGSNSYGFLLDIGGPDKFWPTITVGGKYGSIHYKLCVTLSCKNHIDLECSREIVVRWVRTDVGEEVVPQLECSNMRTSSGRLNGDLQFHAELRNAYQS